MRGYGQTSQPQDIDQYTLFHLVGDMVGVLDALSAPQAVVVGHDWGAPVAWHCALFRPDRFRAVAGLSVPFRPRGSTRPTSVMPQTDLSLFYQLYFQAPGVAEAELERNPRETTRRLLYSGSGDVPRRSDNTFGERRRAWSQGGRTLTRTIGSAGAARVAHRGRHRFLAGEFVRKVSAAVSTGIVHRPQLGASRALRRAKVIVPALYIAGDRDLVVKFPRVDQLIANLKMFVPNLTKTMMLPGCGHWTQQERASEVNAALIAFLREVGRPPFSSYPRRRASGTLTAPGPGGGQTIFTGRRRSSPGRSEARPPPRVGTRTRRP